METLTGKFCWGLCAAALTIASSARGATADVSITNFSFQPPSVTINTGDSVRWTEKDSFAFHTTTSDDGLWGSQGLDVNQQFTFQFTAAGDYPYHCTPHPFMQASVSVQASANQPPTVSITSPANGASFTAPAVVPISANASDSDGSVTNVAFFDGTGLLGQTNQTPYTVTATLAAGVHPLTAVATDNLGLSATSAVVSVIVTLGGVLAALTTTLTTVEVADRPPLSVATAVSG